MLANRIKDIINKKNKTSKEVASELGMSAVYFSKMINGNPTVASLQALAKVLGCEVGDFFIKSDPIIIKIDNDLHTFYSIEELKDFINKEEE